MWKKLTDRGDEQTQEDGYLHVSWSGSGYLTCLSLLLHNSRGHSHAYQSKISTPCVLVQITDAYYLTDKINAQFATYVIKVQSILQTNGIKH